MPRATKSRKRLAFDGMDSGPVKRSRNDPVPNRALRRGARIKKTLISGTANANKLMPYCYAQYSTIAYNAMWNRVFRGNSLYDPDYAVGGDQPMGFDQMAGLYTKYYVKASALKVTSTCVGSVDFRSICVWADRDPSSPASDATGQNAMERALAAGGVVKQLTCHTQEYTVCSSKAYTKNITDYGFDDPNVSAAVTANPVTEWYWHICITPNVGTDMASRECKLKIEIMYDAVWFDAKALAQS